MTIGREGEVFAGDSPSSPRGAPDRLRLFDLAWPRHAKPATAKRGALAGIE